MRYGRRKEITMIATKLTELNDKFIDYLTATYNTNCYGDTVSHELLVHELVPLVNPTSITGNPFGSDRLVFSFGPRSTTPYIKSHLDSNQKIASAVLRDMQIINQVDFMFCYYLASDTVYVIKGNGFSTSGTDLTSFIKMLETQIVSPVSGTLHSGPLPIVLGSSGPIGPTDAEMDLILSQVSSPRYSSKCDCGSRIAYNIKDDDPGHAYWCSTHRKSAI